MKSKKSFLQVLQIKIKEFCKIVKITKDELYSKLGIISTKNLPDFELRELIKTIENTLKSICRVFNQKMNLIRIYTNLKLAINQIKQRFTYKSQFKKLKRTYNQNTQTFIYSKIYQKNL